MVNVAAALCVIGGMVLGLVVVALADWWVERSMAKELAARREAVQRWADCWNRFIESHFGDGEETQVAEDRENKMVSRYVANNVWVVQWAGTGVDSVWFDSEAASERCAEVVAATGDDQWTVKRFGPDFRPLNREELRYWYLRDVYSIARCLQYQSYQEALTVHLPRARATGEETLRTHRRKHVGEENGRG